MMLNSIEDLVRRVEGIPDRESRQSAHSLMEAILELHGTGLERMLEIVFDSGDAGKKTIRQFAGDPLIASLLVLHGLHPDDIETRVVHALAKTHGEAELLGVFEGVVRVRIVGGQRHQVEAALREAVPDAAEIVFDESAPPGSFVPLAALMASGSGTV